MKKVVVAVLAAFTLVAMPVQTHAASAQAFTTAAKALFLKGNFQVPASACTASGQPSPCCTGNGAGAGCPVYKMAFLTSSATAGASTTTWASISANEASCTGTCTGWASGGVTLATYNQTGTCIDWADVVIPSSGSGATLTAQAAVIYCASGCPSGTTDVISIHCLDGTNGTCVANTASTGGTFTVTMPAGGPICIN